MRHAKGFRKLNRATDQRIALLRSLAQALFLHGNIITTAAKAKEARRFAEKIISLAKRGTLSGRRKIAGLVGRKVKIDAARFEGRAGGFTRLTRLAPRRGDGAPQARLELL